jgi:hypothetical protein
MNFREFNSRKCDLFRSKQSDRVTRKQHHIRMPNQIATATIATTITAHATGPTFFELPLRGESLAAWLNLVCII